MRTLRHLFGSALTVAALVGLSPKAQAQTPYNFSTNSNTYTENFSTIANWSNIAAGATAAPFSGTTTGAIPASRFGRLPTNLTNLATAADATPTNVTTNLVFAGTGGGGVQKNVVAITGITQPSIALLATGTTATARSTGFDLFFDFTSRNAGTFSFNWAQLSNAAGTPPRTGTLRIFTATAATPGVGDFTQLGSDITVTNGVASAGSFSQGLPSGFNGSATARVRFYYTSALDATGSGNRPGIAIDDIVATATAMGGGGSPTFGAAASVATTTTTAGTPSTGVSVSFNGSNLTGDITATASTNFEVSTTLNGTYGTNATIPVSSGTPQGSLFVRLNTATAGVYSGGSGGTISYAGGGVVPAPSNTTVSGTALATQPTTQPTISFSNNSFNSVDITLTGGNGQKYLVVGRVGSAATYLPSQAPSDGVAYTASTVFGSGGAVGTAGNFAISSGTSTTFTVTNLASTTQYSFAAFAYNDDNTTAVQNYLTSGFPTTAPSDNNKAQITTLSPPPNIYLWVGAANGSYTTAANWLSQAGSAIAAGLPRTTPAPEDILQFGSGTSSVLVDLTGNETIGGLELLTATSDVTLTMDGGTNRTITINGVMTGDDFTVPTGASLKFRNNTSGGGLNLTLSSGGTGTVSGTLDVNGVTSGMTTLTSDPAVNGGGVLTFTNGSFYRQGDKTTGSTISGATFQNGATLEQKAGSSPATNVVFAANSTYILDQSGATLAISGRTYGNLTVKSVGNGTSSGGGSLTIAGDLTVDGATTLNLGGTGGMQLNGNLTTLNGGTVRFIPALASQVNFNSPSPVISSANAVTFSNVNITTASPNPLVFAALATGTGPVTLDVPVHVTTKLTMGNGNLVSNGNLTLLSTAARTAYVENAGTGIVTGTTTVQRAVDGVLGTAGDGYRHYSSPVAGPLLSDLATGSSPMVFNTNFNSSPAPQTVTPYPNIFRYDPTLVDANNNTGFSKGYQSPAAMDVMESGKGYSFRKDRSTVDLTGTLNTGAQSLGGAAGLVGDGSLGTKYGFNLVGNPYPSALRWNQVTLPAGVSLVAYVNRPTGPASGVYVQYDHSAMATNNDIAMAQGFFVRKTDASASIAVPLTNAMRLTTGDGDAMQRTTLPTAVPSLRLTIGMATANFRPEASVYFEAPYTDGLDDGDGIAPGRSYGNEPTLATMIGSEEASVNRLSVFTGAHDVTVAVLVATPVAGAYTIDTRTLADFPANTRVLLEDAVTGTAQDLAQNPTYAFTSTANYAGQRFTLRFTANRVTGLAADLAAASLSVFPNPAVGTVRVSAPANAAVTVIDAVGRVVRTTRIDAAGAEQTLNISGLRAGLYTVRAGAASQKLVIE